MSAVKITTYEFSEPVRGEVNGTLNGAVAYDFPAGVVEPADDNDREALEFLARSGCAALTVTEKEPESPAEWQAAQERAKAYPASIRAQLEAVTEERDALRAELARLQGAPDELATLQEAAAGADYAKAVRDAAAQIAAIEAALPAPPVVAEPAPVEAPAEVDPVEVPPAAVAPAEPQEVPAT